MSGPGSRVVGLAGYRTAEDPQASNPGHWTGRDASFTVQNMRDEDDFAPRWQGAQMDPYPLAVPCVAVQAFFG